MSDDSLSLMAFKALLAFWAAATDNRLMEAAVRCV